LVLEPLGEGGLNEVIRRALKDEGRGWGGSSLEREEGAERTIVEAYTGDARQALGVLRIEARLAGADRRIGVRGVREAVQQGMFRYDTTTAFQVLSAFHKSLRARQG